MRHEYKAVNLCEVPNNYCQVIAVVQMGGIREIVFGVPRIVQNFRKTQILPFLLMNFILCSLLFLPFFDILTYNF